MPIVVIPPQAVQSRLLPPDVQQYISIDLWNRIMAVIHEADAESVSKACCIEITCCICCFFPFIFLCHPCITASFIQQSRAEKVAKLNFMLFGGLPVVSLDLQSGGILVNTDLLNPGNANQGQPVSVAQPVFATTMGDRGAFPTAATNSIPIAVPTAPPSGSFPTAVPVRMISITVPEGCKEGDSLTAYTPDGAVINVSLYQPMIRIFMS